MCNAFRTPLFFVLAMIVSTSPKARSGQNTVGAFAIGRGGAAAKEAVSVQHEIRKLLGTTGSLEQVDIQKLLTGGEQNERQSAQDEALTLLSQGKNAYDELELEQAKAKFRLALKKFEYAYGYIKSPGHMIETMMFLGATMILAGEPEKGLAIFRRVAFIDGQKTMSEDLFPPNIQEVFQKAQARNNEHKPVKTRIVTKPFGSEIYVDDKYRGGSPLNISNLTPGVHMVRALKDGFFPWGGKIKIRPGKENKFMLSPKPLPKRKTYSSLFGRMSAELIRSEPGQHTKKFCRFLGTNKLVVAVLEGEPSSMAIRAYTIEASVEIKFKRHKKVFDLNSPQYASELKAFLLTLLDSSISMNESSPAENFDKGEKDSAKLLADSEKSEDMDEEFGLDLTDKASDTPKQDSGATTQDRNASGGASKPAEVHKDSGLENKPQAPATSKTDKFQEANEVIQKAAGPARGATDENEERRQFAFTWTYFHDKWWFWTGVGLLAAGAATGTYFAITAGTGQGGGTLVLGLH